MAAATNILTPTESGFLAQERAENIALLRVLKELPSRPKANQPPRAAKAEDRRRQLTLEDEKRLASALAFLAGISNDPNSVMAVCLEEIPRTSSIRVLIAINMERPPNGAELLEIARQGLEQVFDALTQSHAGKATPDEEDSQGTITSISRDRILARLRGNSRAKRIHTAVVFEEGLNAWEVQSQRGRAGFTSSRERFASFEQTARRLQTLFNQCTSEAPREADLVEMVQLTSQLQKTSDLLQLLHRVQLSDNNPSLKDRLSRVLGAISRYSHVAKYLCRACRRIERLQNVTVQAVDLDSTAFFCPDATVDQPQLKSRLNTIRTRHNFDRNLESMYRLPEVTTLQGRNRFESTFENTIEQSKIHAEIQIVAFYDLEYPVELSPRVIRSHKEACSLCNLFIEVHGRYWTPGTHGRLYPGWRRPYIPTYRAFQVRLNELLEAQIAAVLREISGSRRRLSMTYPNESANFSLPASTLSSSTIRAEPGSSRHAQGPDPGDGEHREQEFIEDEEGILDEELEEELDVDEDEDDDEETRGPGEDLSRQSDAPPTPITAMHAEGDESARVNEREAAVPLTAEISTIRLSPGEARVMDITPSGLSIRCSAGSLRVHMKYSNHLGTGQLRCRFEWLSDEEASQILAQNTSTIIAVRSLSTATETPRRVLRQ